jgi:hypothetical protein
MLGQTGRCASKKRLTPDLETKPAGQVNKRRKKKAATLEGGRGENWAPPYLLIVRSS